MTEAETRSPAGIRGWIVAHDDSRLFTVLYIGSAVVLSIAISLFWLVVVVAIHGLFEHMRQRHIKPELAGVVMRTAWHLKLDVALVLFALALAVYMEVILGVAGLGGAARVGLQGGARVGGWARAIRGILLSVDDGAQVARAGAKALKERGSKKPENSAAETAQEAESLHPWRKWGIGDHIAIWLALACIAAIVIAPYTLDGLTWGSMLMSLLSEFHPWPGAE